SPDAPGRARPLPRRDGSPAAGRAGAAGNRCDAARSRHHLDAGGRRRGPVNEPGQTSPPQIVSAWQRFWFAGIPPHIYALLRITIGVAGVWSLLGLTDLATFWDLEGLVSRDGLIAVKAWAAAHDAGGVLGRVVFAACLASLVAMSVGFRSALTVPLTLVCLLLEPSWNYLPLSGAQE